MLDRLNRHVLQPLAAMKGRSRHLEYLRVLRQTQFDPPAVVGGAAARRRCRAVLQHA